MNLSEINGRLERLGDRLRIRPGSPNVFGTESSFSPPEGGNWAPGEPLRGYYIDFRTKLGQATWPPPWQKPRPGQYGVAYAQWGLGAYERYLDEGREEWLGMARAAGDYIVETIESGGRLDGAWLHLSPVPHTFPVAAPWISAMAQGECASLLARLHVETGEEVYADAASRTLKTIRLPVAEGGTLAVVDGNPFLEEYPTEIPSCVLNGAIFAIWGLYDVGRGLDDGDAMRFFEETVDGLAALLPRFDTGAWSLYDLYPHRLPNLASASYHLLHIRQLTALARLAPRPAFEPVIENFERYRASPANRRRAFAGKVLFRLLVPRNRLLAHRLPNARMGRTTSGGDDALVLCYHAVSETWPADLSIHPDRLREHLLNLKGRGYRGVRFGELAAGEATGKVVAVTFDDGYRSVIRLARPILAEVGFPGTLFVPTDWIGSERPMAWDGIEEWLGGEHEHELVPMGWDEVRELRDAGWEIGSHTASHPRLTEVPPERLASELRDSRERCAAELGTCTVLAYPYGDHDERVVEASADAGYAAAATLPDDLPAARPLAWPRIGIYNNDDLRAFKIKTSPWVRRARGSSAWPRVAGGLRSAKRMVAR